MSKQRMVVEWSPHDETLFAVGADNLRLFESTCVKLAEEEQDAGVRNPTTDVAAPGAEQELLTTQRKRSFRLTKINSQVTQLKCMEWYPFGVKPLMIATGMGSGKVMISDFEDPRVQIVREFAPKYNRPCNAVAWNRAIPSQIVAGFDKVRSDFCTLVWDLNTSSNGTSLIGAGNGNGSVHERPEDDQESTSSSRFVGGVARGGSKGNVGMGSATIAPTRSFSSRGTADPSDKPIHELANSEATVALSWVPSQPTCLATGTGFKWLRIYDLRTAGASAPMSVVAHTKAVLGVVFDQHRPHVLATYTDSPQEPVKVWDIRRLDNSSGAFLSLHPTAKTLSQVSWCPSKPGILVTSSPEEKGVSLWDVNKQQDKSPLPLKAGTPAAVATPNNSNASMMTIKKPFKRRYTSEPLASFSWQHISSRDPAKHSQDALSLAAFPNRLLTASISGEIEDISVHDTMPISISSRDCVAFSCGRVPFSGRLDTKTQSKSSSPALSESISNTKDISLLMYERVQAGYSLNLASHQILFSQERTPQTRALRIVWQWVDQVEALRRSQATRMAHQKSIHGTHNATSAAASHGPLRGWPIDANLLIIAGVRNLLSAPQSDGGMDSRVSMSSATGASTPRVNSETAASGFPSVAKVDSVLGCQFYESGGRRLALLACNWDPDCGQVFLPATTPNDAMSSASGIPPRPPIYRSSSGAWNSAKLLEDSSAGGTRSLNEAARHELRSVVGRLEAEGDFPRGAAICVFHGDLQTAVTVLQRGAMNQIAANTTSNSATGAALADVYQLVAMAIAGFSSAVNLSMPGPSLWSNMCSQLLKREEIVDHAKPRYLHALLSFLIGISSASSSSTPGVNTRTSQSIRRSSRRSWGSAEGLSSYTVTGSSKPMASVSSPPNVFASILNDTSLALSDRVAFACRFLPDDELGLFLKSNEQECVTNGKLDGLVLTGLDSQGMRLLQNYLDVTGDTQTLALLAARLPSAQTTEHSDWGRWITIYRELLNHWQLYHERARFDVERAQLDDVLNSFASLANELDPEEFVKELNTPTPPSAVTTTNSNNNNQNSIPPQLFVRCNFCNASLSLANLLRLGGSHSTWLNRAKPKLNCCPSCRKPLPQCALCLLPFGSLNPYFELAHRQAKQTSESVLAVAGGGAGPGGAGASIGLAASNSSLSSASSQNDMSAGTSSGVESDGKALNGASSDENLSQLSSIPFVEWFTWCQSCKHGGHAHHIADWFKTHSVCPVTDCACKCLLLDSRSIFDADHPGIISAS